MRRGCIWSDLLGLLATVGVLLGILVSISGCGPNTEAIERTADKGFSIVNATLQKALAETSTRTGQLQGTMTAVEPGWVVEGYGVWGTGLVYQGKIYIKGGSGTLQGATQTDQGQAAVVPPPVLREGSTTKPSE